MYEQHISNEDIKKFVSAEGQLKGKEWDEFVEFSKEVNGHIRNCPNCLAKVREAQKVYDQAKEEIAEIDETIELSDGDYSSFDLADDIQDIENNSVRVAVMLHYADRLIGIPAVTDYIARKATDEEKKEILEVFKREGIHINPEIFPEEFKDDINTRGEHLVETSDMMHDMGHLAYEHDDYSRPNTRGKHNIEVSDMMHDMGHLAYEHDGYSRPSARGIAELDKDSEIKESELVPIKKKGFKEWIKGLVDKLMGKGEK